MAGGEGFEWEEWAGGNDGGTLATHTDTCTQIVRTHQLRRADDVIEKAQPCLHR